MRTKNFLIWLFGIVVMSIVMIILGPSSYIPPADDSIRSILSQSNQQLQHLKDSVGTKNQLEVDDKYLTLLGYPPEGANNIQADSSSRPVSGRLGSVHPPVPPEEPSNESVAASTVNGEGGRAAANFAAGGDVEGEGGGGAVTMAAQQQSLLWTQPGGSVAEKLTNFSLVSYVLANQLASAVQLVKNLNAALVASSSPAAATAPAIDQHHHNQPPNILLLYDLGLSEDDQQAMQRYCSPLLNSAATASSSSAQPVASPSRPHLQPALVTGREFGGNSGRPPVVKVVLNGGGENSNRNNHNYEAGSGPYYSYSVVQNPSNNINYNSNNSSNTNNNNNNVYNTASSSSGSGGVSLGHVKCLLIKFDLTAHGFPSYVIDDAQMHAFRPLIVRHALHLSRSVFWLENGVRLRPNSAADLAELRRVAETSPSGVRGWRTEPTLAVSARTHPKMYDYFHTDDDNFKFLKMISLDALFFVDRPAVHQQILLPWIKCALIPECIHPIGAQSNGCKLNKKPQYRYSGCHDYDASALNVVLGLTFGFDEQKYALDSDREALFYTEDESMRILEQMRKNISDTSDHPYTED